MEMESLQKHLEAHSLVENMQKLITGPSESGKEVCPICLQEFMVGCEVRSTRCSHKYHENCLIEWLKRSHYSCPLCRKSIPFTLEEFLRIVQSSDGDAWISAVVKLVSYLFIFLYFSTLKREEIIRISSFFVGKVNFSYHLIIK